MSNRALALAAVATYLASSVAMLYRDSHAEFGLTWPWMLPMAIAAFLVGFAFGRWWTPLLAVATVMLVLFFSPGATTPDSDGATLRDWLPIVGLLFAAPPAALMLIGVAVRKVSTKQRGRHPRPA